jgi:hypothetical protein
MSHRSLKPGWKMVKFGEVVKNANLVERDLQFEYINETRTQFYAVYNPALSVDAKKKEMIGNFKNPGTRYQRQADLTNDHDFLTQAKGKAALYGV